MNPKHRHHKEYRSYKQACALAASLDIVGQRWTLLLIRELMGGQRRFRELLANLPGIGSNLLAARLSLLQGDRLVKKFSTLSNSIVYRLTDAGRALEPALVELARWGNRYGRRPQMNDHWSPLWNNLAFKARFDGSKATNLRGVFAFSIAGYEHYFIVENKQINCFEGVPPHYHTRMECTQEQFMKIASMPHDQLLRTVKQGTVRLQGDRSAFCRFLAAFE